MAQVIRPLFIWHRHRFSAVQLLRSSLFPTTTACSAAVAAQSQFSYQIVPSYHRSAHFRSRSSKFPVVTPTSDLTEAEDGGEDSDSDERKSRNAKKREARQAVRWGMELAAFSDAQLKRIIRVLGLGNEVFDALMLVKSFGRDIREAKRRQFNYIGRLLRGVEPDLMDSLILVTKEGDRGKFEREFGPESWVIVDKDEVSEETDSEDEEEQFYQGSKDYLDVANRWFDGLINKDADVTKEVYSLSTVEFDRQELRGLVRKFSSAKERQITSPENGGVDKSLKSAERSLTRFLRALARQVPTD